MEIAVYNVNDLCTEVLGCESCHQWAMVAGEEEDASCYSVRKSSVGGGSEEVQEHRRRRGQRTAKTEFPPPLKWLRAGRSRYLRAVRDEGRLLLTEIVVDRPPANFLALRRDGRLRLQFVEEDVDEEEEYVEDNSSTIDSKEEENEDEGEDQGKEKEWWPPVQEIEGSWRCQETVTTVAAELWCNPRVVTIV